MTTPAANKNDSPHRIRNKYYFLGTDQSGATHVHRTTDETIFALDPDSRREYRFDIDDPQRADAYVDHVRAERGWANCNFGIHALAERIGTVI